MAQQGHFRSDGESGARPAENDDGFLSEWPSQENIRTDGHRQTTPPNLFPWRGGGFNDRSPPPPDDLPPTTSSQSHQGTLGDARTNMASELAIRVKGIPQEATLLDLHTHFSQFGNIASLCFFETVDGVRQGHARILFEPLPTHSFWRRREHDLVYLRKGARRVVKCRIEGQEVRPNKTPGRTPSPVNPQVSYQSKMRLFPRSMDFGVMLDADTMMSMKHLPAVRAADGTHGLEINVDLNRKTMRAIFTVLHTRHGFECPVSYNLELKFDAMTHFLETRHDDGAWALVLSLPCPPRYSWRREHANKTFSDDQAQWTKWDLWYRAVNIADDANLAGQAPTAYNTTVADPNFVDLGRWRTFRFMFDPNSNGDENEALRALSDYNIPTEQAPGLRVVPKEDPVIWSLLDQDHDEDNSSSALAMLANVDSTINSLDFEVRYNLEVCLTRGILNEHRITREFLQRLSSLRVKEARGLLAYVANHKGGIADPMAIFEEEDASLYFPSLKVPPYCTVVRRATVTPTIIYFGLPVVEVDNRVLRHYKAHNDRFLRVQFVEEGLQWRISSTAEKEQNDDLFKRVLATLTKGIRVGDRVYEFLAFGNSQIRECGAYFFAPTDHVSCDDIRQWMGDFKHIRNPAKYASRLGQCFSTTRAIRGIQVPRIRQIPDVERNRFCFTDGIGKISEFVANMVIDEMGMQYSSAPSAFQFRMGGCKGVLAVWPDCKHMEVHIRQSQEKFVAIYNGLEVIRGARYAVATLNCQTIAILSSLGVPDKSFMDLLNTQLTNYNEAMEDNEKAMGLLRTYVDENEHTLVISDMIRDGFLNHGVREPFVATLLNLWRIWSLQLLKQKARLVVEKGAFVIGCVDETATLRGHSKETEGSKDKNVDKLPQIFLQVSDSKAGRSGYRIITGICLIGRNPSLHPGDLRIVEAVDVPALRHLRDVVVFPQKGDRDVPSMLSGGDLDGDDFFVIWDETLIPDRWNHPPMHGSPSKPKELDRDVNMDDVRQFFVLYMKNDILAQVALAHRAHADRSPDGVFNPKCLELAEIHSKAVDYVKTGEPASYPRRLRPRLWPHFMEKQSNSYRSHRILGKIYDSVTAVHFDPEYGAFDRRVLDAFGAFEHGGGDMLAKVRQVKFEYDQSLRSLMAQRGIGTEFEFWTGFALSKPVVGSQYKLQEDLGREGTSLKMRFRESIKKMAGGATFDALAPYVAAMYKVTEEEVRTALVQDNSEREGDGPADRRRGGGARLVPLISFPWIYHWVLGRIATQSNKAHQTPISSLLDDDGDAASKTCNISDDDESGQEQKHGSETEPGDGDNLIFGPPEEQPPLRYTRPDMDANAPSPSFSIDGGGPGALADFTDFEPSEGGNVCGSPETCPPADSTDGLETTESGMASMMRRRRHQDLSADSVAMQSTPTDSASGSVTRDTSADLSANTSEIELVKIEHDSAQDRLLDLFD